MIAKLQYITQGEDPKDHLYHLLMALEGGIDWIQLRLKGLPNSKLIKFAKSARDASNEHGAKLIINDHVKVAASVNADGVHLGLDDMDPSEARKILGDDKIIGGTANTIEDIQNYVEAGVVDYIGLGPFAQTSTKEKLSPILGIEGYQEILKNEVSIPIIAVGGINQTDISPLLKVGIHGVAVSSLLTDVSMDFYKEIKDLVYA